MNILFVNAYFFPETIAFSHLEKDLIEAFIGDGHQIQIICPTPTRQISDDVAKEYRKKKRETLYDGKVNVIRFSAPREKRNPIIRAFRYFWCNFREYQIAKKIKDVDVIFAVSTPPTQGMLCAKLAKKLSKKLKRKIPFIYSLQDIFPDSLLTTGLTKKDSLIWKIGRKIESFTYNNADKIIVISDSMKKNILSKDVPEEKVSLIPNWVDISATSEVSKSSNSIYDEFNISREKFTVVYAGNFGAAQGAEIVIESAETLKSRHDIQFVIFGGGPGFENAKRTVEEKELTNVTINSLLPQNRVSEVYSLGDVAIITCKRGVGTSGMPSKTWSIMACNTPIIASFDTDSELSQILTSANAGVCVEPENAELLSEAICEMADNVIAQDSKSQSIRDYVTAYASKEICTKKYTEIMKTHF